MKGYMRSPSLSSEKTTPTIPLRINPAGHIDSRKIKIDCTTAISSIPMEWLFVGRAFGGHLMV